MKELLNLVNKSKKREDIPKIKVGDTVEVYVKIKEGNRERIQMFDGTVISTKGGNGISATFTVRKIASGVGVEKTFMFNSPSIDRIKIIRHGKVRRAKLYYLRERVGKAAKIQEKIVAKTIEKVEKEIVENTEEEGTIEE